MSANDQNTITVVPAGSELLTIDPASQQDDSLISLRRKFERADAGPLARLMLMREHGRAMKRAFRDRIDSVLQTTSARNQASTNLMLAAIQHQHDRYLAEIRGTYLEMMRHLGLRVELDQLGFLEEAGEKFSEFIHRLEANSRILQPMKERILDSAMRTFDRLFDNLEQMTHRLLASTTQEPKVAR